jgi:hypothetical protein
VPCVFWPGSAARPPVTDLHGRSSFRRSATRFRALDLGGSASLSAVCRPPSSLAFRQAKDTNLLWLPVILGSGQGEGDRHAAIGPSGRRLLPIARQESAPARPGSPAPPWRRRWHVWVRPLEPLSLKEGSPQCLKYRVARRTRSGPEATSSTVRIRSRPWPGVSGARLEFHLRAPNPPRGRSSGRPAGANDGFQQSDTRACRQSFPTQSRHRGSCA